MNKFLMNLICALGWALLVFPASGQAQCQAPELAIPTVQDVTAGDQLGRSIAMDGDYAVVGAPEKGLGTGGAYVFHFDGAGWQQVARLTASDGVGGDKFGISVGLSGDVVVVGAYQPFPAEQPGKVYVFEKPGGGWADMNETAVLTDSQAANNDNFGYAVDIDGDVIVVGAYLDDVGGVNSGSAFVFDRPAGGWVSMHETARLNATDANENDQFGIAVAIAGGTIAVGADRDSDVAYQAGAAYVFEKPATGWAGAGEDGKLTVADPVDFDRCGLSVAVGEGFVAAGAWGDDQAAEKAGAVHVFERPAAGWTNLTATAKLLASDAASGDHLGWSLDAAGAVIVAGAPANLFDGSGFGAAYLYLQPAGGWADATEDARLLSSNLTEDDEFATAVRISGPLVGVGARFFATEGYSNAGAAYLFGGGLDCNANQVLDLCEIISGSGADADGNGLLDECESPSPAPQAARDLILKQNQPNPFNPSTEIRFTAARSGQASLRVFDMQGRLVRTLLDGWVESGPGSVVWNGRDDQGRAVGSGVYAYRLSVGREQVTRRMVLLK